MPKRCPDCQTRTSTLGRCPNCRAEHLATTAGYVDDDVRVCAWCGQSTPHGHYERPGMWLGSQCVREQLAAETPDALNGAVRWAGGDRDAYPDADPAALQMGPSLFRVLAELPVRLA